MYVRHTWGNKVLLSNLGTCKALYLETAPYAFDVDWNKVANQINV